MSDYYCPNCGADLEDQFGFSQNDGYWTCTECGQFLTDPEDSPDDDQLESVGWFCDECGAYLNKQFGFSCCFDTWTCTECGFENSLSEDEIYESEEDYQIHKELQGFGSSILTNLFKSAIASYSSDNYENDDEDDCEDDDDDDYEDDNDNDYEEDDGDNFDNEKKTEKDKNFNTNFYQSYNAKDNLYYKEYLRKQQNIKYSQTKNNKRTTFFKRMWSAIAHKKFIDVNVSLNECIGQNFFKVVSLFEESGFTKIHTNVIEDLKYCDIHKENLVSEVSIGGSNDFNPKSRAKYDDDIIITYHKLCKVFPPISFKDAKKRHGKDVIKMFIDAGFVNVVGREIRDLTFGWIKKDGKIDYVTLAEERKFKSNNLYRIDTPVVVAFHTFKNKR